MTKTLNEQIAHGHHVLQLSANALGWMDMAKGRPETRGLHEWGFNLQCGAMPETRHYAGYRFQADGQVREHRFASRFRR